MAAAKSHKTGKKPKVRKTSATPAKVPHKRGKPEHKRTTETERVVRAVLKANPDVAHNVIWGAIGIGPDAFYKHYGDIVPRPGPGAKPHIPTKTDRVNVARWRAFGLSEQEIADLAGWDLGVLKANYAHELATGHNMTLSEIGNRVVHRAMNDKHPHAQRAAEFLLDRRGGANWLSKTAIGVGNIPNGGANGQGALPAPPLVNGSKESMTRDDARRVAFLLAAGVIEPPAGMVLDGEAEVVEERAP